MFGEIVCSRRDLIVFRRLVLVLTVLFMLTIAFVQVNAEAAWARRITTVGLVYVTTYHNRLINAQASVAQLQQFLDTVHWEPRRQYSFLRDVMHNSVRPADGYVNTPLGFGYGSCGASTLLNKLVQTAMFRDKDDQEKPLFKTVMIWTWRGDRTYGKYGATIYVDPTGKHTRDYVWQLNPEYDGPPPLMTTHFDMQNETVMISAHYGNWSGQASAESSTSSPTQTVITF